VQLGLGYCLLGREGSPAGGDVAIARRVLARLHGRQNLLRGG